MKKLLRWIIRAPLMLFIGAEGDAATTTDAGAAAAAPVAEQGGTEVTTVTTDTTGAVPDAAAAELAGGENTEVTEGDAAATTGIRQTTFEQRVNELAAKKIAELEQRLTARQTAQVAEKPNFIELDMEKVKQHFTDTLEQIEALKLEGRVLEAMDLQDGLNTTRQELRDNEQRKADFLQKAEAQHQNAQQMEQINARIVEASEIVRADANIPPEVWKKGEEFFIAERTAKPLIDAKYREMVMIQGPIAALQWAKSYCEEHMGAKAQTLINQKEAAKATLPPGKTATGAVVGNPTLDALKAKASASPTTENLAAYSAAKRAASAQQQ